MTLAVQSFDVSGPLLITPKRFLDSRGFFSETYNARAFAEAGIVSVFVQDNHSLSRQRGTVRGLHFQAPPRLQEKLVRVVKGRILDVAIDLRISSPTFGGHVSTEIGADDGRQFYVPVGFAHGFCTLEPDTEVFYKVTDFWAPECEGGVLWNDPALGIAWPDFAGAQVVAKDAALPRLSEFATPFHAKSQP
ncbi:MAG TPA: dTDP-4-dehydrorhamnose 3,5-epimerase [Rhizomicrobium sp.]|jgi:dTDP-4-dehydrorhamnose 3,5-epimerase|nr:dTDP-4-dehydrorhamnose 3,5-epimerase [Rhizomicrobium sp.]